MNKALLDTDILSEIAKGVNQTVAANATAYRAIFGRYTLSAITVMEVVRGFHKNQSILRLQAFLASLASEEVIPFYQSTAELAGKIAGDLERVGRQIGTADTMIAAIAIENGLELATATCRIFSASRRSAIG